MEAVLHGPINRSFKEFSCPQNSIDALFKAKQPRAGFIVPKPLREYKGF